MGIGVIERSGHTEIGNGFEALRGRVIGPFQKRTAEFLDRDERF
jgi:hypothetical protein